MEYIIILKKETDIYIKKFNDLKRWFFDNRPGYKYYFYEDKISFSDISNNNFIIVSPYVFPVLNSYYLEFLISDSKTFAFSNENNSITYLSGKYNFLKNTKKYLSYEYLSAITNELNSKTDKLLYKFDSKLVLAKYWFYIDNEDIKELLNYFETKYFRWNFLNRVKLKLADNYPKIIFYDGKNKIESKKIIEKININTPKTYQIIDSVEELSYDILNNYPNCIIKPSNLAGGMLIFRKIENEDFDIELVKSKLKNFDKILKNSELTPYINQKFKPKIIIEEYIKDLDGSYSYPCELKFYIFNGKIKFILAINRKVDSKKFDFFDENFNRIPNNKYSFDRNELNYNWQKFNFLDKIKEDIQKIYSIFQNDLHYSFCSRFIRMDFFVNNDNYYFGEFSLFPNGGSGNNLNTEGKKIFIEWLIPDVQEILNENEENMILDSDDDDNDINIDLPLKLNNSFVNYLFS